MDGDIDVYKHFAWLKRVSDWLLCLGLRGDEQGERPFGCGVCALWGRYLSKFSMRI